MLVMKHFNTCNVWSRDTLNPLTPKTKLRDNWFYIHCVKRLYLLWTNHWQVMFWFVVYVNESIKITHRERVCFQGMNSVALFTFKNKYCASSSSFGTHTVSTVTLTNYECTHKATTRQSVWNRFYWQVIYIFLRNLTFSVICNNMLNITHYNNLTSLCCYSCS